MKDKSITEYCNDDYLEYANYVVEHRAIPSVIDGLKPTQRKIIHIANKLWRSNKEKALKVFQFGGKVSADAYYHHGDSSLNGAIIGMAQKFKNSMPLLDSIGQYGSLRSPSAGAPRYISTKLHPNFRLIYKDFELLNPKYEEGYEIEPNYFLPIIPTVLLNGQAGIAVGFATKILNRNPVDLIEACINYLNDKKIKDLHPWNTEFKGTYEKDIDNPNKWIIKGSYSILNTTTVKVSELPPNITYEKYEKYIADKIDKRQIVSYDDNCSNNIDFTFKFSRAELAKYIKGNKLDTLLKIKTTETENFTTLDENGKLKIFNSAKEILKYFVDFRLKYYDIRKQYLIDVLEKEILVLSNKAKFIKGIIDGKIKVNKIPKDKIIEQLTKLDFDEIDGSFQYLLSMPIYSLTKEKYEELLKQLGNKKDDLKETKKIVPKDLYIEELKILKNTVKKTY